MLLKRNEKGFTLIELVMVIVILAILAIVAVPQFFNLAGNANTSSEAGMAGGVRAGIATVQASNLAGGGAAPGYPATLDAIGTTTACTDAAPCFVTVLGQGGAGTASGWSTGAIALDYVGPAGGAFTYTPATGTFQ